MGAGQFTVKRFGDPHQRSVNVVRSHARLASVRGASKHDVIHAIAV
jgi:hypothetical protein